MLSVNGIYDGKQIIPTEPVPLKEGTRFKVIITFIEPIEDKKEGKAEPNPTKWDLSKICGSWQGGRDAEEIIDEIYKEREKFNIREATLGRTFWTQVYVFRKLATVAVISCKFSLSQRTKPCNLSGLSGAISG
jgi:predicted DNA-binding antitoxin AbrB/MazE fold protein